MPITRLPLKIVQIFTKWVISLKRFRLFSQKLSHSPSLGHLCETLTKVGDFFECCMGWGEKKRIMVVFHDICQNYLHIQHQATKLLNINAKLVVVEVAPPHFRPTPKISRRFFKTSPRFVLNTVTFFLKDRGLS